MFAPIALVLLGIAAGYHFAFWLLLSLTVLAGVILIGMATKAKEMEQLIVMIGFGGSFFFFIPAWITDGIVRGWLVELFRSGGVLFK